MANRQQEQQQKKKILNTAELICIVGIIIGVVLDKFNQESFLVYTLSLSTLAIIFMLSAFTTVSPHTQEEKQSFVTLLTQSLLPKVVWINSAVAAIGILFALNLIEGNEQLLYISFTNYSVILALFLLYKLANVNTDGLMESVKRAVPLFLFCSYLLFL